ncbi:MAG TPA: hypothetical protein VIL13_09035 [Longimicrobiales bacterium]
MPDHAPGRFSDELERWALPDPDQAPSEPDEDFDLLSTLRSPNEPADASPPDLTLGGYFREHNRPPAFEGIDGQPYTVDVDVDETGDPDQPYAAYLVFLRWATTGAGIMAHLESRDVARGRTEDEARNAALQLSLYEVKAELDETIRRRAELEE